MFKKGIFLRKKYEYDSKFILSPIENFDRDKYLNLRLLLRFLPLFPFGYYVGVTMYYSNAKEIIDLLSIIGLAILTYIISFYLLQIPHEFIHYLIYSKGFKDKDAKIKVFNRKRLFTAIHNGQIKRGFLIISLICPTLIIIGSIILFSIKLESNNIIIGSSILASIILSTEDILNCFLSISKKYNNRLFELPNDYKYLIEEKEDSLIKEDALV